MSLLILMSGQTYPSGYDYYVDQEFGDDANPGTRDAPWASLSRVHAFANPTTIAATLTLSALATGEQTVTRSSGTWSADDVGKTLEMRAGDDDNPGGGIILSVDGAVATVSVLVAPASNGISGCTLVEQRLGQTTKVWVAAATWGGPAVPSTSGNDNNTINPTWYPATATRLEVHFEAGSVMDDSQADPLRSCFGVDGGANLTFAVYGDAAMPLQILNYGGDIGGGTAGGSGQAFAGYGSARIEGRNFFISVCGDGISLHNNSTGDFQDGHIEHWQKLAIANTDQSYADFTRVTMLSDGEYAFMANSTPTAPENRTNFLACKMLIDADVVASGTYVASGAIGGGEWRGGQIGTPSRAISLNSTTADDISDTYLNARSLSAAPITFTRCFGRFTYRQEDNVALGQTFRHCVFTGPASVETGAIGGLFYRNFNPGGDAQRSILDCVISGYSTGNAAAGANYGATDAGYWIASNSELRYCCFHGNAVNVDADLESANTSDGGTKIANNLTVDPELTDAAAIAAGSVDQADFAVTNAALIGTGSSGGNIGFTAADIA